MIASGERVFADSGAWIALAVVRDPLHERARAQWELLERAGARLFVSVPVVIETFTFLDRRGSRELALAWKESLGTVPRLEVLPCTSGDLKAAHPSLVSKRFHKLSIVDATSFVLMRKSRIRVAFAFDVHFGIAGFRYVA